MNWQTIEQVAKNTDKKWYLNQTEVSRILGCSREIAGAFLEEHSVPYCRIGKAKSYFLPEVLEAVDKTRWTDGKTHKLGA